MPDTGGPYDFVYVDTDIPEGMTIREWRLQRTAERERLRAQNRVARRASRPQARSDRRDARVHQEGAILGWTERHR